MRHRKSCFISTQVDFNNKMCLIWYPLAGECSKPDCPTQHSFFPGEAARLPWIASLPACQAARLPAHCPDARCNLYLLLCVLCGTCEASMLHFRCHLNLIASYERVDNNNNNCSSSNNNHSNNNNKCRVLLRMLTVIVVAHAYACLRLC